MNRLVWLLNKREYLIICRLMLSLWVVEVGDTSEKILIEQNYLSGIKNFANKTINLFSFLLMNQ